MLFYIDFTWFCTLITSKGYNYILPEIFKALGVWGDSEIRNTIWIIIQRFNPLNTELNPICHLLALL